MSPKQRISYLDEVKPYKTTRFIQVKVIPTWKQFNAQFDETLIIIFADKKVKTFH
ncbi:hypothetical protein Bca101_020890 [Brassica carinata]